MGKDPSAQTADVPFEIDDPTVAEDGFIESYGRLDAAECLIFCGWMSHAYAAGQDRSVTVRFERGSVSAPARIAFHRREDLGARGVGFVILAQSRQRRLGQLLHLELRHGQDARDKLETDAPSLVLTAAGSIRELSDRLIAERAAAMLEISTGHPNIAPMQALLKRRFLGEGYIDAYGHHAASGGWLISGWISNDWIGHVSLPIELVALFDGGASSGVVVLNFFERPDLAGRGLGVILHFASVDDGLGRLHTLLLTAGEAVVSMRPAGQIGRIASDAIEASFLGLITESDPNPAREKLRELVCRAAFSGRDTLVDLPDQVLIGVDEAICCGDDSVVLMGWLLTRPDTIRAVRLRSAEQSVAVDMDRFMLWVERPDVMDAVGRAQGFEDSRCGFILRIPIARRFGEDMYLEVETRAGDIGFKPVPRAKLEGMAAIRRMLAGIETQYNDIDLLYDRVLGPAIAELNTRRLAVPTRVQTLLLGAQTEAPRISVIVPLYGRVDFMELQMALFATNPIGNDVEIIYVLDDPLRMREVQFLAASLYERFKVPFKLLCLSQNLGYAPANNVGLRASSGEFVCFMNSDVFPDGAHWLGRLVSHLEADPGLGVVGPVLLFEDDSVQHQGIEFRSLPQFAGWLFAMHKRKGFRLPAEIGLVRETAITGACMVMRRCDIGSVGAFDDAFIIGDFEDTDLCFRLRARGLSAAVDFGVRMHHLERKSQESSAVLWRTNLTLYNAWVHQRRWADTIRQLEGVR